MRNTLHMRILAAVVLLGAEHVFAGCKSAPDLSEAQALKLVQAKYDQTPVGATVLVDDLGMRQGISAQALGADQRCIPINTGPTSS